jgi:general secretion pathway protein D
MMHDVVAEAWDYIPGHVYLLTNQHPPDRLELLSKEARMEKIRRLGRSRGLYLALLLVVLHCCGLHGESAKKLYKQGQVAEAHEDLETAFRDYSSALSKNPNDIRFKVAVERIRQTAAALHVRLGEKLEAQGRFKDALIEFFRALEINPGNALATQDIAKSREQLDQKDKTALGAEAPSTEDLDKPGPPIHLGPLPNEKITLHMTEQSDVLYRTIGKLAGLTVMIDPEFIAKRVTIDLKDAEVIEALNVLGDLSHSFWKASTRNAIYVAPDTRPKRAQLEQMAVQTFYLTNASQQIDINDITTTLRNVLIGAKMYAVASQNAIVIRGTPDEILLAKSLISSLDVPRPEVLVDVYIMEVSRDKLRNIGISPPTSLTVTSSSSSTLNQIGRSSSYSYSIGQAQLELLLTDSDTQIRQNPSVRAVDGQKAMLKIGERIPVATGSYTTATSSTTSAVQTQFQYIDVGVSVEITPTIHEDRDVTLKLAVEVSSQTGTDTIDDVQEPVISQEKAEQVVRLKDGEVTILGGLVKKELTHSVSGTPGLGEVPLMKYLFSTQETEAVNDELVFMVIPHIVRAVNTNKGAGREIDTGSGESIRLLRIPPTPTGTNPVGTTGPGH